MKLHLSTIQSIITEEMGVIVGTSHRWWGHERLGISQSGAVQREEGSESSETRRHVEAESQHGQG